MDDALRITPSEIAASFSDPIWAEKYPPILTIEQAAGLLQLPVGTLRDWRSRGMLKSCSRRMGKHVRFYRDRLIHHVFNGNINQ